MSQDAMMVFDQVHKKEIVIRHIPVQEGPEAPQTNELISADAATQPISPLIAHLMLRMQALGEQFNSSVHSATKDLIHQINVSIEAGSPSKSVSATRLKIMTAQNEFLAKVLAASKQMNSYRQSIAGEIQSLSGQWHGNLAEEIVRTEAEVQAEEARIQQMVDDYSQDLSRVMRACAAQNELKAYLKGLKFQVDDLTR